MSTDFVSEVDKRFFADNLLLNEDWENGLNKLDADLSSFLDVESPLSTDELLKQLPDDLEIPMFEDGVDGQGRLADLWKELSDSSDSGLDVGAIKEEPLSPASLISDSSQDCIINSEVAMDTLPLILPKWESVLDSPPLTPPRDGNDVNILPSPTLSSSAVTALTFQPGMQFSFTGTNTQQTEIASLKTATHAKNKVNIVKPLTLNSPTGGITQIINPKVKIQPKPIAPLKPRATVAAQAPTTGNKPLVLTAEEFAKLTSQGLLKFQPPACDTKPILTSPPVATPSVGSSLPPHNADLKTIKRQQRMIKNRESACLSRKRKKEYLSTLEVRLHEVAAENQKLKEANNLLERKISALQTENQQLKSIMPGSQVKKVSCLLGILFLVSLNLAPLSSLFGINGGPQADSISSEYVHHGRTLKSVNDNIPQDSPQRGGSFSFRDSLESLESFRKLTAPPGGKSSSYLRDLMLLRGIEDYNIPISMCPSYFNSTESQRLMNELTGWVMGHKEEWKKKQEQEQQEKRKKRKKRYHPPRKLKAAMKPGHLNPLNYPNQQPSGQYEVQVFTGAEKNYNNFMEAIHRRNDTFYVVSFRHDHLLLPATSHNKTMRPRMSLVMPALSINDSMSPPSGSIAMMQIDCEVMATKMVHVHKSSVPSDMQHQNNTSSPYPTQPDPPIPDRREWERNHP